MDPELYETLSAHLTGLEAALGELDTVPAAEQSFRRLTRSLARLAPEADAGELAERAAAVEAGGPAELRELGPALVDGLRTLLSGAAEEERVLLVEDDPGSAALVRAFLESPGRTVDHADSAAGAERLLTENRYDVLILDLILGDRDGRDLLIQVRAAPDTSEVPVVVLSAAEGMVARAECIALGADDFVEKPPDPGELRATVADLITRAREREDREEDELRRVPSRAALGEAFEKLRAESGSGPTVAVVDVDSLEAVDRTRGPEAAEEALEGVVGALEQALEQDDVLGRWGGEEFVVLFSGASVEEARTRLETALRALNGDGAAESDPEPVTFCAGIAAAPEVGTLAQVVSTAEGPLFRARAVGPGRILTVDDAVEPGVQTVLVVEDDKVTAKLIEHRLTREGFEVLHFTDGAEAWEFLKGGRVDLVILDVKVPGMNGFEILERLRDEERTRRLPVMVVTAMGGETDVVRGLGLGASDYMLKPFSPSELLARARRLLKGAAGSGDDGSGA